MGAAPTNLPPPRKGSLLLACGPGCALLIIAGLIALVVGWRVSVRSFDIRSEELREDAARQFDAVLEQPGLPAEAKALVEQARTESERAAVGYFGRLLYVGGVIAPFQDGEATPEDLEVARETREFLAERPAPMFWTYGDYVSARPVLQQIIEEYKEQREQQP